MSLPAPAFRRCLDIGGHCTAIVRIPDVVNRSRDESIVRMYLDGEKLEEIGYTHKITATRARQVVARYINECVRGDFTAATRLMLRAENFSLREFALRNKGWILRTMTKAPND